MNRKKLIWQLPLLTLLVVGTVIIISQQRSMPYQKISGFVFGTVYNITYQGEEDLRQEIEAELRKVDADFSMFNKQSIVSKINRGEKAELSDSFLEVYDLARQVSDNTGGAFDVTVAPSAPRRLQPPKSSFQSARFAHKRVGRTPLTGREINGFGYPTFYPDLPNIRQKANAATCAFVLRVGRSTRHVQPKRRITELIFSERAFDEAFGAEDTP